MEKKKSNTELPNEEHLIQKQIEDSLNKGIREVAEITASLTAEATIRPEDELSRLDGDTQLNTQDTEMESTLVNDTLMGEEDESGIITIKDPEFEKLSTEEKRVLTSIAKEKVANEVAELLNPGLQEDAKAIANDMEQWLGDESINKAASEIEKEKHAGHKTGDEEEEGEDEEEEGEDEEEEGEDEEEEGEDEEEEGEDDDEEEEEDGNLSGLDDEEIDAMILTDSEVAHKTKIWYNANKKYLEEMAVRRVLESNKKYSRRKDKSPKNKKLPPPSTPAEAAKQLLKNKKIPKNVNQDAFDNMFESPESIAKIKERDSILNINGTGIASTSTGLYPIYEVVEEPGDIPDPNTNKTEEVSDDDDDEEKFAEVEEEDDDDDMDDSERFLRNARKKYTFDDDDDDDDDEDEDF